MKQLVKHLMKNHHEQIVSRSLINCHVIGLHSIMLLEAPEKTIRLYVAEPDHQLVFNSPFKMYLDDSQMTLAFHPHHCNLTIHVIKGTLYNWRMEKSSTGGYLLNEYEYHSKITEGEQSFKLVGKANLNSLGVSKLEAGYSLNMYASDIHTVAVEEKQFCAWLVYEGKEDPDYKSVCYTNNNPNLVDKSEFYKPATRSKVEYLLQQVGLL